MLNRNDLLNYNGNNGEDAAQASNDNEENSTTANDHQRIHLSRPAIDRRTTTQQHQQINRYIVYESEATIPAIYWFILSLFGFVFYLCWPLFIVAFIGYQLLMYNNQSGMNSSSYQALYSSYQSHYSFDLIRDAEAEGRTAQPTEEDIRFSDTVEILDHVPYGIQTAQTPNLITFVDLNIIQHRDIITTNENNEDGVIDGNQQRGRTLLTVENFFNSIENNLGLNQINTVDGQPVTIVPSPNEALETEGNVATPAEAVQQRIIPPTHSRDTLIPKSTNSVRPNGESGD